MSELCKDSMSVDEIISLNGLEFFLRRNYQVLMESIVLSREPKFVSDSNTQTYSKKLRDLMSKPILDIYWKRTFVEKGYVACWRLATELSATPADVARLNQDIRVIITAAECYGLLQRMMNGSKKPKFVATRHLHDFQIQLALANKAALAQYLGLTNVAIPGSKGLHFGEEEP